MLYFCHTYLFKNYNNYTKYKHFIKYKPNSIDFSKPIHIKFDIAGKRSKKCDEVSMKKIMIGINIMSLLQLMLLPGCFIPSRYLMRKNIFIVQPREKPTTFSLTNNHTITIWLHGTRLFSRPLYNRHFQCQPGLTLARTIDTHYKLYTIAHTLVDADPQRFHHDNFYIFGWSGKLCFLEREYAADKLYISLLQLIQNYKAIHGIKPKIRIIAHSHGGNVALNLANLAKNEDELNITELILMACPVQGKTKHLAQHPMFEKIYVLYSALDLIQILDPQGMYKHKGKSCGLFSKRQFFHQPNLAQMKVKINRRAIMHSEFSHPQFLRLLPRILDEIDAWNKNIIYNEDPNKICKLLCVYTDRTPIKKMQH